MTKNVTEPFLENCVSCPREDACLYMHILALKRGERSCFGLCFPRLGSNQQRAHVPDPDLNPVQAGCHSQRGSEDRVGATATTFNRDTVAELVKATVLLKTSPVPPSSRK